MKFKVLKKIFHLISVPIERPTIRREHFNSWYSTNSYFCSLILSDVPVVIVSSSLFAIISYTMTHQPMELFRFGIFMLITAMTSFVAQAHGILIGALFELKVSIYSIVINTTRLLLFLFLFKYVASHSLSNDDLPSTMMYLQ